MSESQDVGSGVQLHNLRKSVPGCIDAAGTEIVPLDLDGLNDIAFKADKAVGGQGQPDMGSIPESWAMSQAFNGEQPWPAIDVRVDVHAVMYHMHNEPVEPSQRQPRGALMSAVTTENYFDRKWNLDHPELGTGSVSTDPYLRPDYYELERDTVFLRSWLNLGRVEEIPELGDYFTKDIAVCNASVIVVRSRDGAIRAFHNACRHRSNKLAWQEKGSCQSFNCKFHGWSYDLDGRLQFVPDQQCFYDLDKNSSGLLPVHVDTWNGFIFVNLNDTPPESLREYLAELGERLDDFPFEDMTTNYCYRTVLNANWKTAMHAYNEVYHLGFVHKETGGTSFVGRENMFGRAIWVGLGVRHQTISAYGNPNHQLTPVEALAAKFGPMFSQGAVGGGSGLNPGAADMWAADVNVFFPNFFIDTFMGSYFTYNFWPLSHEQTLYEYRHYTLKPENAAHRFTNEFSRIWLRELLLEDIKTIEQSQQGLNSRAVTQIQLGDSEIGVRHHLKVVDDSVTRLKHATQKEG